MPFGPLYDGSSVGIEETKSHLGSKLSIPSFGGTPPTGDWILATGFWDDAGIWDDASNWID